MPKTYAMGMAGERHHGAVGTSTYRLGTPTRLAVWPLDPASVEPMTSVGTRRDRWPTLLAILATLAIYPPMGGFRPFSANFEARKSKVANFCPLAILAILATLATLLGS